MEIFVFETQTKGHGAPKFRFVSLTFFGLGLTISTIFRAPKYISAQS